MKNVLISLLVSYFLTGCSSKEETAILPQGLLNPSLEFKPNILWLVAEDLSPVIPAFGDSTIVTPNLNRLAAEGVSYDNFYSPAAVCSPARAAIITGMYPNSIGANHMRTGPWYAGRPPEEFIENRGYTSFPEGLPYYEAVPPAEVKMFTEYLRTNGYFTSNNSKEDYQFVKTMTAWDKYGTEAHWRQRGEGQPFFSVFNFGVTHESRIWAKMEDSLWIPEELEVPIPPYLPDTEVGTKDVRRMYSNILEMDAQVGNVLDQLEADGLLDSTIVFWYTDHGGPLPRQKRLLHDSGIKVPLVIRYPDKVGAGKRDNRMISFIDLAPTIMSLTGIIPPKYMDGKAFLGNHVRNAEPRYVFAAADRFDEVSDQIRAVKDERYKYIKYYKRDLPMLLKVGYREQMPIMRELHRLKELEKLTPAQALWMRETKPEEELFDTWTDPHEVWDLSKSEEHQEILLRMRKANEDFLSSFEDLGMIDEKDLLKRIWPNESQPKTANPAGQIVNGVLKISCETDGASIGYRPVNSDSDRAWTIYTGPVEVNGGKLEVVAHRLGYLRSEVTLTK